MPETCCCVPFCSTRSQGHAFPSDSLLRKQWLHAIKRDKFRPTKHSRVCSSHFKEDDYLPQSWESQHAGIKRRKALKKGSVPSVFEWSVKKALSARGIRRQNKDAKKFADACSMELQDHPDADVSHEVEVQASPVPAESQEALSDAKKPDCVDAETQTVTMGKMCDFSVLKFKDDAKVIQYYTGFDDFSHFVFVFNLLGPAAYELNYGSAALQMNVLDPKDAFFLTLIKLRRNTPDFELAVMFAISDREVSTIFHTWLNFLYFELKEWGIGPSDGNEADVKIILDCTEIKIDRPSNPTLQQATYSSYKSANTVKVLVGISPSCLVTHVSDAYCGSYSDKAILESSGVLDQLDVADVVLAVRGFQIEQMCADRGIVLNVPASLSGKSQLSVREMRQSTYISSRRIHVERAIGLAKTYHILTQRFHFSKVIYAGRIIFVCFMLANLRRRIV